MNGQQEHMKLVDCTFTLEDFVKINVSFGTITTKSSLKTKNILRLNAKSFFQNYFGYYSFRRLKT